MSIQKPLQLVFRFADLRVAVQSVQLIEVAHFKVTEEKPFRF